MKPTKFTARQVAAASLGALALSGCVAENARTTIGSETDLPILSDRRASDATLRPADAPSISTLSREAWADVTFVVEPDGTRTRPNYVNNKPRVAATARQRGDPPTPRSALQQSENSRGDFYREAASRPFYALGELVLLPYRLFRHPPTTAVQINPQESYWRAPVTDPSLGASPVERHPIEVTPTPVAPLPGGTLPPRDPKRPRR